MPTEEQWQKLVRVVKRKLKEHDIAISDLWQKVNDDFEAEVTMVDEQGEDVKRLHRAVNRLTKRVEELEAE